MSRLRVFREADFSEDEAPTEPGGFALAQGTGTIATATIARARDADALDPTDAAGADHVRPHRVR